jgi:taurine transport system permease protein
VVKGKKREGVKAGNTKQILNFALSACSILLLLWVWFSVSAVNSRLIPTPAVTWERFLLLLEKPVMRVSFGGHILISLRRILLALIASWIIGISFGVFIGWNKKMNALLGSVFELIRPIPPLAWIPLITICFGIGEFPKLLIVFIGAVMPVIINSRAGMQGIEQIYLDVGIAFNGTQAQVLKEIAIPAALPVIFAGIRTSTSVAWSVVLAAEMIGANAGVGFLVVRGMNGDDMALVVVAMITIGVIGALLSVLTSWMERLVCPWMNIK